MPKLTKRTIDSLKPDPVSEVFAWDSELKGFGVRIMPSGIASYILKYRNKEGRQRRLALGRVGALTPEESRNLARQRLAEVAHGSDPSAERQQVRKSITVAELCDLYTADAEGRIKASTLAMDKSRIERHVKPLIGPRTVLSLTPADIAKLQADIIAGKTARERGEGRGGVTTGGKGAASRTVGMLGTILEFAKKRRVVKENVARGIERPPEGKQRRFLSAVDMKRLGSAMREAEAGGESTTAIAAVRFLLLSGCPAHGSARATSGVVRYGSQLHSIRRYQERRANPTDRLQCIHCHRRNAATQRMGVPGGARQRTLRRAAESARSAVQEGES